MTAASSEPSAHSSADQPTAQEVSSPPDHRPPALADTLGLRYRTPTLFQRSIQTCAGTAIGAWLTSKTLAPLDRLVSYLSRDRISLSQLLAGLPVITLTTTGRKSGMPRRTRLIAIPFDHALAVIGTNFGQPSTPAWTLNLQAHPTATVSQHRTVITVQSRKATPVERMAITQTAAQQFPGVAEYDRRLMHRRAVAVFLLESTVNAFDS